MDTLEDIRRALYQDLERHWEEQADHYGYDSPRPDRMTGKMQAVLGAGDRDAAYKAASKVRNSILTHMLAAWASGRIPGPTSPYSLERRIKKTESLARMLREKGQLEQAQGQERRVLELREQLKGLTAG